MSNAIVMLVDDNSFIGACVTIYSLQKHAKRSYDLIVFYWDKLSELNKIKLKRINRNIIFKKILVDDYKLCKFSSLPRVWEYNCAYRFDIFTLSEYEKIIYINEKELENCPICNDMKCNIKTKCIHTFCEDCLEIWLNNKRSCPYCREELFNSKFYCIELNQKILI
jgi:lipopolysaccharide biosynthesis glycosyltransferase